MALKIPIDIKTVLESLKSTAQTQNETVHMTILVDREASSDLISTVRHAFQTQASNIDIQVRVIEDASFDIPKSSAFAILVAGGSSPVTDIVRSANDEGISLAIVTDDIAGLTASLEETDDAPSMSDIIGYRLNLPADKDVHDVFLDDLGGWIVDRCPEGKLALANAFPFIRHPLALEAARLTALENAAIGAIAIIPGADMPVMTANQAKMVLQIAAAYGETIGFERAKELVCVVAGGFIYRAIARQLVSVVPFGGWAVKGGIGYSGTLAMGYAAIRYFETGLDDRDIEGVISDAMSRLSTCCKGAGKSGSVSEKSIRIS